jgi:hypothetical protein
MRAAPGKLSDDSGIKKEPVGDLISPASIPSYGVFAAGCGPAPFEIMGVEADGICRDGSTATAGGYARFPAQG